MKFIIAALIGSIIGYLTNWIAIKMLFRPHEEKRFLGFKVPFTPGLIPKEKSRIANSVGKAIGEHLLSSDTIIKALCSETILAKLKNWIREKMYSLVSTETTLEEKIKENFPNKYEKITLTFKSKIISLILLNVRNESNLNKLKYVIETKLKSIDKRELIKSNNFKQIKEILFCYIKDYAKSDALKYKVEDTIKNKLGTFEYSQKTIKEVIPQNLMDDFREYFLTKKDNVAIHIKELLYEEVTRNKLKAFIEKGISNNMNPLMSMFIDSNTIVEKVIDYLENYLEQEDGKTQVVNIISTNLDKLLEIPIADLYKGVSEDGKMVICESVSNIVFKQLDMDTVIKYIEESFINHISDNNNINDIIDSIFNLIKMYVDKFIYSEKFETLVENLSNQIVNNLLKNSIKNLSQDNKENIIKCTCNIVENIYNNFIENQAEKVINILNIPKIVENQINEFDVDLAEKIILDIASKELKAITWLGGLLGGIIGLLSPILNSLY